MSAALLFALRYFGLIKDIIQEGIVIAPDIANLVSDGYAVVTKIFNEKRAPTADEEADLNTTEQYWRTRLHSGEA